MYIFRHLVDAEYSLGPSFMVPQCDGFECLSAVYRCPYSAYRRWIRSTIYNIKCGLYESCVLIVFLVANRMTDSVPNGSRLSPEFSLSP